MDSEIPRRRGMPPGAAMRRERPRGAMWAGAAMAHTPADVGIYKKKSDTIRLAANRIAAVIMLRTVNTAGGARIHFRLLKSRPSVVWERLSELSTKR